MSTLFTFLENFAVDNLIKIYEDGSLIYEGEMGDVPQRITNMMNIIEGTAKWSGEYLEVMVKRDIH